MASDSSEQERWFNEAEEKYRRATEVNPRHAASWVNWGALCAQRGKAAKDDVQKNWYTEAEKKFDKVLEIDSCHADNWFDKACLASLRQDVATCVNALEQWRKYAPHASAARLDDDADFDNVRDTPEFQALRKKLETGQ